MEGASVAAFWISPGQPRCLWLLLVVNVDPKLPATSSASKDSSATNRIGPAASVSTSLWRALALKDAQPRLGKIVWIAKLFVDTKPSGRPARRSAADFIVHTEGANDKSMVRQAADGLETKPMKTTTTMR